MANAVMELVGKLTGRKIEREAAVKRGWDEIVIELADGKKVRPDDAEKIIEEAGKTPADLAAAVETELDRRRLKAMIEPESALRTKLAQLNRDQESDLQEYNVAKSKFESRGAARNDEKAAIEAQLSAIETAKVRLRESASDEAKRASTAQFQDLVSMNRRRQFLIEQMSATSGLVRTRGPGGDEVFAHNVNRRRLEYQATIRRLQRDGVSSLDRAKIPGLEAALKNLDAEEAGYRKELAALEARIAKLNRDNAADTVLLN